MFHSNECIFTKKQRIRIVAKSHHEPKKASESTRKKIQNRDQKFCSFYYRKRTEKTTSLSCAPLPKYKKSNFKEIHIK
ncbi:hypothetical protein NPIL_375571 [Nephila pilipes]|uniref:Uncharacterized protein n=1 Tax=Nephila pilipes TaxID=299642 RepID=A0A8X6MVT0_NEPPI|nr:hypothetical protein NPIL_375571 [Nephila pilipes]